MKKFLFFTLLGMVSLVFIPSPTPAQSFIKKVKKKAEDAAIKEMFEPADKDQNQPKTVYTSGSDNSPSNNRGGGLDKSAPDVLGNIESAESSFEKRQYSDAREAVRRAILDVELEIGKNILDGLPESISGLPAIREEDQVTSSGIGFVGLLIQRVYRDEDQEMRITVGNDAAMLSAANFYLSSGTYATSNQDENVKQTKFKDHRAVIEYDESSGYQLSVPFGQSSVLITNGINYDTENDFMHASEEVDIEDIKNKLGEK